MTKMKVSSEIYDEFSYKTDKKPHTEGNIISEFPFNNPDKLSAKDNSVKYDEDGDLVVERSKKQVLQIEHSVNTELQLVGLQVWRGAFLLGDLALYWGATGKLKDATILEVGAGTGLTSFVAAMYAKKVICTDIDKGGILDLIRHNAKLNKDLIKSEFLVKELDFTKEFSKEIKEELQNVSIIFAADVIYDDDLTQAFVDILEKLLCIPPAKKILIALEKRFVFTLADMDSVAPCYETFLRLLNKCKCTNLKSQWKVEQLPIDFPQYFMYDRVKELVLWQIST